MSSMTAGRCSQGDDQIIGENSSRRAARSYPPATHPVDPYI